MITITLNRTFIVQCVVGLVIGFTLWRLLVTDSSTGSNIRLFAEQEKQFEIIAKNVPCSATYLREVAGFPECTPKRCGRYVMDNLVTKLEVELLLSMVQRALTFGGSSGGVSRLDVYTGAMSSGVHFVNVYKLDKARNLFNEDEVDAYRRVSKKLHKAVSRLFGVSEQKIYITRPPFFFRLTNAPPQTIHDIYWTIHVDKIMYDAFHYTTLLYLSDFGKDFTGGQFSFVESDNLTSVVEPRKGRVLLFTSGEENKHFVSKVQSGVRFAAIIGFTCDGSKDIKDVFNNPFFKL